MFCPPKEMAKCEIHVTFLTLNTVTCHDTGMRTETRINPFNVRVSFAVKRRSLHWKGYNIATQSKQIIFVARKRVRHTRAMFYTLAQVEKHKSLKR